MELDPPGQNADEDMEYNPVLTGSSQLSTAGVSSLEFP